MVRRLLFDRLYTGKRGCEIMYDSFVPVLILETFMSAIVICNVLI